MAEVRALFPAWSQVTQHLCDTCGRVPISCVGGTGVRRGVVCLAGASMVSGEAVNTVLFPLEFGDEAPMAAVLSLWGLFRCHCGLVLQG